MKKESMIALDLTTVPIEMLKGEINRRESERCRSFRRSDIVAPRMTISECTNRLVRAGKDIRANAVNALGGYFWALEPGVFININIPYGFMFELGGDLYNLQYLEALFCDREVGEWVEGIKRYRVEQGLPL